MNASVQPGAPAMILPMAQPVPEGAGEFCLPSREQPFVLDTIPTAVGDLPRVGSALTKQDLSGHYLVRWNSGRDRFTLDKQRLYRNSADAH
jgi:hypothetical protein